MKLSWLPRAIGCHQCRLKKKRVVSEGTNAYIPGWLLFTSVKVEETCVEELQMLTAELSTEVRTRLNFYFEVRASFHSP